jgi:hypothetical protein
MRRVIRFCGSLATATGAWNMGVLKDGRWLHFEMDLGNQQHRKAFLSGQVPAGAKTL